ncbi:hypothetical protein RUM43_008894 [Polyplax serrata]|uniref:RRM domain-containing protein n=1 Tax=Polyplax serrata TaxID=468196 RepID=A0AAN8S896_POLSC
MTNRRRSAKGRTSASKKPESPRKLTRRSKRSKKSETPEREEPDSDYSGDEQQEDGDVSTVSRDENSENYKDTQVDALRNEDQRSQLKEDESGGSDGSWKVKSENGGGGGIPKLKLCLTRPPEMSSPTSVADQHPSPRRRRRSGRGNATPTKEENQVEDVVEECTKRVTRNQRARNIQEAEVVVEEKPVPDSIPIPEPEPEPEPERQQQPKQPAPEPETKSHPEVQTTKPELSNSRCNVEEDETRMAVESICNVYHVEESQSSGPVEAIQQIQVQPIQEALKENLERSKPTSEVEAQAREPEPVKTKAEEERHESQLTKAEQPDQTPMETEPVREPEPEPEQEQNSDSQPQPEIISVAEKSRSSSRDSSEERAKEAALRSKNKNRRTAGSEEGEVVESPRQVVYNRVRSQDKTSPLSLDKGEGKENSDESAPVKSGARKRRWGSSTNKTGKKSSVSISTDFLKEIIPEVKPLPMSEVQLSPNEEDEDGQLKEKEETLPVVRSEKSEREKIVQSDESEKDYEEEAVESGAEDTTQTESTKPIITAKDKEYTTFTRKVSVMSSNDRLQKSPSPARNKPTNIIYIVNLVRPFTIPQLKELLARTGTIMEDGFWIDKIKSKCYVKYGTEEEAKVTRHALHGVRWPVSNPKQLIVDFATETAMKAAVEGNDVAPKRPIPSLFEKAIDIKGTDKEKTIDKRDRNEKDKKDLRKHREDEKRDDEDDKEKKLRPPVEPLVRDRTVRRVTMPVREWDVGKNEDGFSPPPDGTEFSRHRDDRYERRVEYDRDKRDDYDDRRRRDKDRNRRSVSGEPARKSRKKADDETPAKLLDDLFRKTKATPCIYWLPLTPEQIAVKEEMRRKHMAEHEKKVAELRKMREQSKRGSDKRRRRTKSRSRSRSVKK